MTSLLPLLLPLALAWQHAEPQWSGFRGNHGSGLATAGGLPAELDPARNLAWRVEVPPGYSSPVVDGESVFLTGAIENVKGKSVSGRLVTMCLDVATGSTRWRNELEFSGVLPGQNSCAAPTPATDGTTAVALFHHFGLMAFDRDGKERWRKPLGPFLIPHGMAGSPILQDGLVVLQVDQSQGSYIAAFDASTGAERWKTERRGFFHCYSTPAVYKPAEGPAQVILSGAFEVSSYALASGAKLWWLTGPSSQPMGVPVLAGGRIYVKAFQRALSDMHIPGFNPNFAEVVAQRDKNNDRKLAREEFGQARVHDLWSGFDLDGDDLLDESEWESAVRTERGGLFAIEPTGQGDVSSSHLVWKVEDRKSLGGVTTPVIVDKTMFLLGEGSLMTSLSILDGKVLKQERVGEPDQYFASPVAGDGRLYLASP